MRTRNRRRGKELQAAGRTTATADAEAGQGLSEPKREGDAAALPLAWSSDLPPRGSQGTVEPVPASARKLVQDWVTGEDEWRRGGGARGPAGLCRRPRGSSCRGSRRSSTVPTRRSTRRCGSATWSREETGRSREETRSGDGKPAKSWPWPGLDRTTDLAVQS